VFKFKIDAYGLAKNKKKGERFSAEDGIDFSDLEDFLSEIATEALDQVRDAYAEQAQALISQVQMTIQGQPGTWPELNPSYKKWKENNGLNEDMLRATDEYLNSLTVLPTRDSLGRFTSVRTTKGTQKLDLSFQIGPSYGNHAGVDEDSDGISLTDLGKILEYGTSNIPPRPHFGPVLARFRQTGMKTLENKTLKIIKDSAPRNPNQEKPPTVHDKSKIEGSTQFTGAKPDKDTPFPRA
jgi:hypothetical protein